MIWWTKPCPDKHRLTVLRERLDAIYAGTPKDHVEDHALSSVVQQYELPRHFWMP
jgi:phytoene synthase